MNENLRSAIDWDERVSTALRHEGEHDGWLWRLSVLVAHSGDSWFWLPGLFAVWLLTRNEWHFRSAILAIGTFGLAVLVMVIKFTVKRSRPPGSWGEVYRRTDPHSFPSGHAARAFLLATLAWMVGPTWFASVLTIWAPLVAWSRIRTGMHFLSDVLAGSLLGVLAGGVVGLAIPLIVRLFPFLF